MRPSLIVSPSYLIVKRIVDSYYGKIDVDSVYGEGTAITISLPINTN